MNNNRKKYKRTWIAAQRKLKAVCSTDSSKHGMPSDDEFESRMSDETACSEKFDRETSSFKIESTASHNSPVNSGEKFPNRWEDYCFETCTSSDTDSEQMDDGVLSDLLASWSREFSVKHNAVDKLLSILQLAGHKLPSTARSLLKTTKHVSICEKSGMQYVYLDIRKQLQRFVEAIPSEVLESLDRRLEISLNIDGLPLFKSSSTSVWPILCAVVSVKPAKVFPVALACGQTKPCNLEFLNDTVHDLNNLLTGSSSVMVRDVKIEIRLRCIVCDAPARAMVKAVKLYSGYEGCDKCVQRGHWIGRMTYPEVSSVQLRTDKSFRDKDQLAHHHNTSPFCELPIDMINSFPIDYMHQCCIGVMKKLLLTWLRGKPNVRMSAGQANQISEKLAALRKFVPKSFARKPRSLVDVDRWKATELRLFLLYFGKLVLKGILNEDLYENFMTLSVAVSILVSPSLADCYHGYANELLQHFVLQCKELYGEEFLVYNVHSMIHMAAEARQFGCLDNCSGFIFENYLQQIKRMVRSGRNPLAQIVKRLSECSLSDTSVSPACPVLSSRIPNNAYILDNITCCEVVNDDVIAATDDLSQTFLLCRVYENAQPLFNTPCDSRILGAFTVQARKSSIVRVERKKLKTQAIVVREHSHGSHCFLAILHDV